MSADATLEHLLRRALDRAHGRAPDGGGDGGINGGMDGGISASTPLRLTLLEGGVGRRSFLARCGGRTFVARFAGNEVPGTLALANEAAINRAAADAGLSPRVVAVDTDAGLLVTEHLPAARTLSATKLREPGNLERCAALLRRLHALPCRPRPFDPRGFVARYIARLGGVPALTPRERAYAAEFAALADAFVAAHPADALCHNDLVATNLLFSGGRLWLIDFEYAVTASPLLDLAGAAAMNGFDAAESRAFVEAYYRGEARCSHAEFERAIRLVRLMSYFWALASALDAHDTAPYRRLAAELEAGLD